MKVCPFCNRVAEHVPCRRPDCPHEAALDEFRPGRKVAAGIAAAAVIALAVAPAALGARHLHSHHLRARMYPGIGEYRPSY